ncbi:Luc7-like protein 3 [Taenia crassiceps]|uniref:Luc7-like protein 3 n=1 Tax=Taenia crassiceps TaxID=6207 RepID=A0ABR4QIG6_9CEST
MALASQAALLDELLGKNRDAIDSDAMKGPHWSDEDMCRYFLCGFCPHDLFVNTKTDLGPCDKMHDERLRENYRKSSRFEKMDVDKRIRRGHERLSVNKGAAPADPEAAAEKADKIASLTRRINDLVEQAEQLGTKGNVDQAQGVLKLCEQLKFERSQLEGDTRPGAGQELERVEEHLAGKMHLGYAKIRDYEQGASTCCWMIISAPTYQAIRSIQNGRRLLIEVKHFCKSFPKISGFYNNSAFVVGRTVTGRSSKHRDRHHHSGSHHRSSHGDKRRRDRSRSRSHSRKHHDRHQRRHSERAPHKPPKRTVSPFSAARRPPEGAEDD